MLQKIIGGLCAILVVISVPVKAEELVIEVVRESDGQVIGEEKTVKSTDALSMTDDFVSLVATIHLEAGPSASIDSKLAVGTVVLNRFRDKEKWGYETLNDVIYADRQFAVTKKSEFGKIKDQVKMSSKSDAGLGSSFMAAYNLMTDTDRYLVDPEIQYFYGSADIRNWADHTYCFTLGGNSFFK